MQHYERPRLLAPSISKVLGTLPLIDQAKLPGGGRRIIDRHSSSYLIPINGNKFIAIDGGIDRSAKRIEWFVNKQGLALKNCAALFITHAHVDHEGLLSKIADNQYTKVFISEADNKVLQGSAPVEGLASKICEKLPGSLSAAMPGIETEIIKDCDAIKFGQVTVNAFPTPGHTLGHLGYLVSNEDDGTDVLYSGDAFDFTRDGKALIAPCVFNGDNETSWQTLIDVPQRLVAAGKNHAEIVPAHSGNTNADALLRAGVKRMISDLGITKI